MKEKQWKYTGKFLHPARNIFYKTTLINISQGYSNISLLNLFSHGSVGRQNAFAYLKSQLPYSNDETSKLQSYVSGVTVKKCFQLVKKFPAF